MTTTRDYTTAYKLIYKLIMLQHLESNVTKIAVSTKSTLSTLRTLPGKGRYIEHVRKYAEGTARSMVANAVRAGKAAHEMGEK